jgi:hypothetical protein
LEETRAKDLMAFLNWGILRALRQPALTQDCCSDRDSKHAPTSRASNPERVFVMEWVLKLEMESLVWKGRERRISLRFQIGDPSLGQVLYEG